MSRVKKTGEVFTPRSLIREMLSKLPNAAWFDPNKTWLEPAAGDGNFLVEIKARLMQAGHNEIHILENMLFSVELIDDNHWTLQHRLGYLIDGNINPKLNPDNFFISKIHSMTQDLNDKNPYHEILGLERDEVLHHRNHVCWTALEYDMSFDGTQPGQKGGERDGGFIEVNEVLPERDLGEWLETDTPDIGEKYIVEKMLGKQPQLVHAAPKVEKVKVEKPVKVPKIKVSKEAKVKEPKGEGKGGWAVHPKHYGTGKILRVFFDGSFWTAKHDDLVDDVNASLKEKGLKTLDENPRGFGASSGLRGKEKYWTRE